MSLDVGWHIRDKLRPMPDAWFSIILCPRKPEGSLGRTAQDGHLDSHTAPELWLLSSDAFTVQVQCYFTSNRDHNDYSIGTGREKLRPMPDAWFNITLCPRKPEGLLWRTAQDGHLNSHTTPELWKWNIFLLLNYFDFVFVCGTFLLVDWYGFSLLHIL